MILSYVMSIFRLPNSLLDEIEKMMNAFWWGHGGTSNKGLHWLSWEKLSVHKNHGGMGFKDLAAFNVAMLHYYKIPPLIAFILAFNRACEALRKPPLL